MNVITFINQISKVECLPINQTRLLESIGKSQSDEVQELFSRSGWIVGELLLLHPEVRTPKSRVTTRNQEHLFLGSHHQEPDLLLQPLRDLHPCGRLGED